MWIYKSIMISQISYGSILWYGTNKLKYLICFYKIRLIVSPHGNDSDVYKSKQQIAKIN